MKVTIDIDTGGTFTDGFFTKDGIIQNVKVDTTPHDLSVCLMNCIAEGAQRLSVSLEEMLENTEVIRYSTTVATNTIIQRTGPKLGLLVTKGFEDSLYADVSNRSLSDQTTPFVTRDMTIGLEEEISVAGQVLRPLVEEDAREAVEQLLDMGARVIVVSLHNSWANSIHERAIKVLVNNEYPRHYLGAVPVILATECSIRPGEHRRTNTALLSAYLRSEMVRYLYKMDEDLRKSGYQKPLLIIHSTEGVARVAKTTPINTYNSGPVAGLLGSAHIGRELYGLRDIVTLDLGGTSLDMGLVTEGEAPLNFAPILDGIPINTPMIQLAIVGAGGGSIAKIDGRTGELSVGPESAGALPGPVAYDLGQIDPTLTDADLILGYLDPNNFLGGQRKLDKDKAATAIEEKIAQPFGITVAEAAWRIKETLERNIERAIIELLEEKGYSPTNFVLFAYGGASGIHCSTIGVHLRFTKMYMFPYNAVFSAVGASTMNILHLYERARQLSMWSEQGYMPSSQYANFNEVVEQMVRSAVRDMRGEGFSENALSFRLELDMHYQGEAKTVSIESPVLSIESEQDVQRICDTFVKKEGKGRRGNLEVLYFRLKAFCPTSHYSFPVYDYEGKDPTKALKGTREVYWERGYQQVKIYDQALLRAGNEIKGLSLIETENTTYLVPPDVTYKLDKYLNIEVELA